MRTRHKFIEITIFVGQISKVCVSTNCQNCFYYYLCIVSVNAGSDSHPDLAKKIDYTNLKKQNRTYWPSYVQYITCPVLSHAQQHLLKYLKLIEGQEVMFVTGFSKQRKYAYWWRDRFLVHLYSWWHGKGGNENDDTNWADKNKGRLKRLCNKIGFMYIGCYWSRKIFSFYPVFFKYTWIAHKGEGGWVT